MIRFGILLLAFNLNVNAQTLSVPNGTYFTTVSNNVTTVTALTSNSTSGISVAVPVATNAITGIGQAITPTGSYLIQIVNGTTTVIQTSKSR